MAFIKSISQKLGAAEERLNLFAQSSKENDVKAPNIIQAMEVKLDKAKERLEENATVVRRPIALAYKIPCRHYSNGVIKTNVRDSSES